MVVGTRLHLYYYHWIDILSFLCCVFVFCLSFVLCLVCPMLPVSLACLSFVLCLVCPMLPVSLACLSSSCVLCAQCYQYLWLVCLHPVSCVPNVTSISGLFVFILCLVCPMLPVSLACLSSSCVASMLPLSTILIFDFPTVVHFITGQRYHLSYPWKPVW